MKSLKILIVLIFTVTNIYALHMKNDFVYVEDKDLEQMSLKDEFFKDNSKYFTVTVGTLTLSRHNPYVFFELNNLKNAFAYKYGKDKNHAKVIAGVYKTGFEAAQAIENFDKRLKSNKPYISRLVRHQILFEKYNGSEYFTKTDKKEKTPVKKKTPKKVKVDTSSSIFVNNTQDAQALKKEFLNKDSKSYSLAIGTVKLTKDSVQRFFKIYGVEDKALAHVYGKNKDKVRIIYGVYKTPQEAREALKELKESLRANKPFPMQMKSFNRFYRKYYPGETTSSDDNSMPVTTKEAKEVKTIEVKTEVVKKEEIKKIDEKNFVELKVTNKKIDEKKVEPKLSDEIKVVKKELKPKESIKKETPKKKEEPKPKKEEKPKVEKPKKTIPKEPVKKEAKKPAPKVETKKVVEDPNLGKFVKVSQLEDVYFVESEGSFNILNEVFANEDSAFYTIDIGELELDEQSIENFLRENDLEDNTLVYKYGENKEYARTIYGAYENEAAAKEAIKELSSNVHNKQLRVSNIKNHQKLYKEFHKPSKKKQIEKSSTSDDIVYIELDGENNRLKDEFFNRNSSFYTITLVTFEKDLDKLTNYFKANGLSNNVIAFSIGTDKKYYKILYGLFDSVTDTKDAIEELNEHLKANKPYISKVKTNQRLFENYDNRKIEDEKKFIKKLEF